MVQLSELCINRVVITSTLMDSERNAGTTQDIDSDLETGRDR